MFWLTPFRQRPFHLTALLVAAGATLLFRYFGESAPSEVREQWRPAAEAHLLIEDSPTVPWEKLTAPQILLTDVLFLALIWWVAALFPTTLSLPLCLFLLACASSLSFYLFDAHSLWYPLPGVLTGGSLLFVLIVAQRLSHTEKTKWRLEKEAEILQEFERMKNNFMGLFSHDLKTPLARIQAVIDRLQTTSAAPMDPLDLEEISKSAEELKKYINNILSLVKVESNRIRIQTRPTDLNVLLRDCVEKVLPLAASKSITFTKELEPLFAVEVDPQLLTEVFLNILDNAIKYSNRGSTVHIKSWEEATSIHVSIRNDGQSPFNFEQEPLREKISEGRSGLHGSGIGLYLVKYFVELHGGKVRFESKPAEGTVVQVTIPLDGGHG